MEYCLPDLGLDGAGEGGRSWPSRSTCARALPRALSLGFGKVPVGGVEEELPDIFEGISSCGVDFQGGGTSSTTCSFDIKTLRRI